MANNVSVKNSAGADAVLKTTDTAGVHVPHHNVDTLPGTLTGVATGAASSDTAVGLPATAVRRDTAAAATGVIDGDYTLLSTDATGKLWVNTATPAGVFAEDAGHTTADLGYQVLTVRQDTAAALAGTDADYQPIITDASGRVHVNVGALPGSLTGLAEDAVHSSGAVGIPAIVVRADTAASLAGTDGDNSLLIVDANGRLHANAIVAGSIAADSAASAAPVTVGGRAATTNPTAVSDGDVVNLMADTGGKLVVRPYAPAALAASGVSAKVEDTNAADVLAASGASLKWYITDISIANSDGTTGTLVSIQDDTPTVLWTVYVAAKSQYDHSFQVPIVTAANKKVQVIATTTSAEITACVSAYKAP